MNKFRFTAILAVSVLLFSPKLQAQQGVPLQNPEPAGIKWMSFTQAVELSRTNPKKIFIDTYTEWCGWCKRMDKTTFVDPAVISLMNQEFYAVKFDAEQKDPIYFDNKEFKYNPDAKAHELAIALLDRQMSYPTSVFLDENYNMLTRAPGYMDGPQLARVLYYFSSNTYKSKTWEQYLNELNGNNKGAQ